MRTPRSSWPISVRCSDEREAIARRDSAGNRTRVEPHQAKLAGKLGAKAGEEEARRGRVLASAVHERHPPLI